MSTALHPPLPVREMRAFFLARSSLLTGILVLGQTMQDVHFRVDIPFLQI